MTVIGHDQLEGTYAYSHGGFLLRTRVGEGAEVRAGMSVPFLFFLSYPHTKTWDYFLKQPGYRLLISGKRLGRVGRTECDPHLELPSQTTQVPPPLVCALDT